MSRSNRKPTMIGSIGGFYRQRRGLVWVIGVATLLFAVVIWLGSRDQSSITDTAAPSDDESAESTGSAEHTELAVVRRDAADAMALGDVDAPVVMVEWLDLRCPFCARFATTALPELTEEYIDTGLLRYEVRDVSFFGEQSTDGAIAARAAAEQGRFHEFLEVTYEAAPERGHAELTRERLIELAGQAGVDDLARFEADLDRDDLRQAVQASTSEAGALGVTSVPFFVIGDVAFAGAQPTDLFRDVIDDALAAAPDR